MSVKTIEVIGFTQQMSSMIQAGIPIINCLNALAEQEENPVFRAVLLKIASEVEDGDLLSEALSRHPKIFSQLYTSMIYAGEQGAGLGFVLDQIIVFLQKSEATREKIRAAFMYPLIVASFGFLILLFLIIFIVPVFSKVYIQMGIALPLPTKILLSISSVTRQFWWVSGPLIGGILLLYWRLKDNETAAETVDWIMMNLPIWGELSKQIVILRFIQSFSNMLLCHVGMTDALSIADRVVNSRFMHKIIERIKSTVKSGGRITDVMTEVDVFSPVIVQMTYAGEESGELGQLLYKCSLTMDQNIEHTSKKILMFLEPVFTVVMAGAVGFIALSIYLPMFDLMRVNSH